MGQFALYQLNIGPIKKEQAICKCSQTKSEGHVGLVEIYIVQVKMVLVVWAGW